MTKPSEAARERARAFYPEPISESYVERLAQAFDAFAAEAVRKERERWERACANIRGSYEKQVTSHKRDAHFAASGALRAIELIETTATTESPS